MERSKLCSFRHFESQKNEVLKQPSQIAELMSAELIVELVQKHAIEFRSRLFDPLTTLWVFITQVLEADHSCRCAVMHFLTTLKSKTCSASTGAYCRARERLNFDFIRALLREQAKRLRSQTAEEWKWKGRNVTLVDGTTVLLPDTPANHREFPAHNPQKRRVSFPIARLVVVICRATGTVLEVAMGSYQGKGSGETSLLKQLGHVFSPADIAVFDRYFAGYWTIAWLGMNQIDMVTRQHHQRKVDLRKAQRRAKNDYLFQLKKPARPQDMRPEEYARFPGQMTLRLIKVVVQQPGFRAKTLQVISSLTSAEHSAQDLALLYEHRWLIEVDLRSIKAHMQMGRLRCKTPAMIRKEVWVHLLAYNMVRALLIAAAFLHRRSARTFSFKAALQLLCTARDQFALATRHQYHRLLETILQALENQRVGNRPGRYEPRAVKRQPNANVPFLNIPREEARKKHWKGCS